MNIIALRILQVIVGYLMILLVIVPSLLIASIGLSVVSLTNPKEIFKELIRSQNLQCSLKVHLIKRFIMTGLPIE